MRHHDGMRADRRIPAWFVSVALAAIAAALLAVDVNDLTFAFAATLCVPLVYVGALEFEEPWRRARARLKVLFVLLGLVAVGVFWFVVGVDWIGRPVDGVWIRSIVVLATVFAVASGWLLYTMRERRRRP